ncbi:unnamed protein product, partial [Phaeothamnion confervicola]
KRSWLKDLTFDPQEEGLVKVCRLFSCLWGTAMPSSDSEGDTKLKGRPKDAAWEAFEDVKTELVAGRRNAKCLGCGTTFPNLRVEAARRHIMDCTTIPNRAEIIARIAEKVTEPDIADVGRTA